MHPVNRRRLEHGGGKPEYFVDQHNQSGSNSPAVLRSSGKLRIHEGIRVEGAQRERADNHVLEDEVCVRTNREFGLRNGVSTPAGSQILRLQIGLIVVGKVGRPDVEAIAVDRAALEQSRNDHSSFEVGCQARNVFAVEALIQLGKGTHGARRSRPSAIKTVESLASRGIHAIGAVMYIGPRIGETTAGGFLTVLHGCVVVVNSLIVSWILGATFRL